MKKILMFGVPIVLLLALVGWRWAQKNESNDKLAQVGKARKTAAANVSMATAGPQDIQETVEEVGTVESPFNVELSPKLTGKITYLELREGAMVTKGQTLVQIDPTETQGQVLQARSAVAQSQSTLAHDQYIENPTVVNIYSQIEQANQTVKSNQADYDQVHENYEAQVHQAHAGVVDAQAKVDSAKSAVRNAEASVNSADASKEDANAKYTREFDLYKQGYQAAQDVDDAKAALKVAEANVKVAQGQLDAAKSAQHSSEEELKQAEDNESIVKKTGVTNIAAAKAKVDLSVAALKYAESNKAQNPAYKAQLNADKAAVAASQGNLNQALARLQDCNLVSTIDGIITKRSADPGTVVNPGTPILTVQFMKWLYVTSAVPVEYTGKVTVGSPISVVFDAAKNFTYNGTIQELDPSGDLQTRQFMIRVKIDNADGRLRPGMYARVHIQISKKNFPVVVPREAVTTTNDGSSTVTMVDSKNVAHIVPVTVGEQDSQYIAITDGLQAGDRVVTLAYTPVRDKQKVVDGAAPKGQGKGKGKGSSGVSDGSTIQMQASGS